MANLMPPTDSCTGISNCYVFKSRLQEYAQKVGLFTPVYETIKEGPSHAPSFQSSVIVNNDRYDSLPGFTNRKAAEQSAAEVALLELAKAGEINKCINQPVHETGLCKNLLQEYAQKMNYAIPLYHCEKNENEGRNCLYTCGVEVGGIKYIGAAAKTKKEAEIKAARTALLAIDSDTSHRPAGSTELTVLPSKKRGLDSLDLEEENVKIAKSKKTKNKNKMWKRKLAVKQMNHVAELTTGRPVMETSQASGSAAEAEDCGWFSSNACDGFQEEWLPSSEIVSGECHGNEGALTAAHFIM